MSRLTDVELASSRMARARAAMRSAGTLVRPLLRPLSNEHSLAIIDQLIVSGASFAATVLIGRSAGSAELGKYSIVVSLLASMLAVQNALILLPYSIQWHRAGESASDRAGSSLALSCLLSALIACVTLIAAGTLFIAGAEPALVNVTWALAAVLPFALMREFSRRFAFARLSMGTAVAIDTVVAAIQVAVLSYLAWTGAMTAVKGCAALGLACAIPALVWLAAARADFSFRLPELRKVAAQSWELGKWLIVGQFTVQVQGYVGFWLSFVIAGAAVTGVYAACMSIVAFANPMIFGVANVLTPKLALAWKRGGSMGLRREAIRNAWLLGGIMALFCAAIAFVGENLMRILFHGPEYAGNGGVITLLALAMLATAIGMPASNALASMERPRAIVVVGAMGAAVTALLAALLMLKWGLLGAAYGFLAGGIIGAIGRWVAFLAIAGKADEPAPIDELLRTLTGAGPDRAITRLGEGDHAVVYAVAAEQPVQPRAAVVKLFKSGCDAGMVQAQFDGLERLHEVLHGRVFDGWTLLLPKALSVSYAPLVLTMTAIPGQQLDAYAGNHPICPAALDSAARAFAAAMQKAWAQGVMHGDLGLRNVLFDFEARTLGLVDPGTLESCPICHGAHATQVAALDVGHLLAELVTDVNDLIGSPTVRMHKQNFVAALLRSVLADIGSPAGQERLLDDIRWGVAAHLAGTLKVSITPRGVWHQLIKTVADRRIAEMLARLHDDLGAMRGEMSRPRAA